MVLVVALLVSLLLGCLTFVRGRGAARVAAPAGPEQAASAAALGSSADAAELAALASRVSELEARISSAAALLAASPGERSVGSGS